MNNKQLNVNFVYSVTSISSKDKIDYYITLLNNKSQLINNYNVVLNSYADMLDFCLNKTLKYYNKDTKDFKTIFFNDILHLFNQQ